MLEVGAFAEREKDLADVVLQVIVNSYMEKVQKWKGSERIMCEALRVLMADELNEERMEGQREGRIEGQREGQREGQIRAYASLVQDGIIPVETGAEKAGMSVDDFTKEMKQAGYQCHLDKDCFIVRNSYTADKHFVYLLYFYLITLLT